MFDDSSLPPAPVKPLGHDLALTYITQSLDSDRLASAYLLTGSPGIGKRLFSRYMAALALCPKRKGVEVCGACESCLHVAQGNSLHFIEFDIRKEASSTSMVERAREFSEDVYKTALEGRQLFYLLPNLQNTSVQVQNSLLKLLEEPPSGVTFILTSDRPEDFLETIVSRCHTVRLRPLPLDILETLLKQREVEVDAQTLDYAEGRMDLALRYGTEPYRNLQTWCMQVLKSQRIDFLEIAEEAEELSEELIGEEGYSNSDRSRFSECARIFLKHYISDLLVKIRDHFVATQILNTALPEILEAQASINRSGHLRLSLEHFFYLTMSRRSQIMRYANMNEVSA